MLQLIQGPPLFSCLKQNNNNKKDIAKEKRKEYKSYRQYSHKYKHKSPLLKTNLF